MPRIHIEAYNEQHRQNLIAGPSGDKVSAVLNTDITVSESDLLSYAMFREQKTTPGWSNYRDLAIIAVTRAAQFDQYFDLSGGEIRSRFPRGADTDAALTEAVGVAVGLSVADTIHGLSQADWTKIPIQQIKDLDFEIASAGPYIVEVEAKGSIVNRPGHRAELSGHAANIEEKKAVQRAKGNKNILYGTIAAIPSGPVGIATCYLLDPQSHELPLDPEVHRAVSRMLFYHRELRFFSGAHFLIALRNRISELIQLNNRALDGMPLLDMDGRAYGSPASLVNMHSIIRDYAYGRVQVLEEGKAFFRGVRTDVIEPLLSQKYTKLSELNFRHESAEERKFALHARLDAPSAALLGIAGASYSQKTDQSYSEVELSAHVRCDSAGRVFGWAHPSAV